MQNRNLMVIGVLLILLLVYGGLRAAEKGIIDLTLSGRPGTVISGQRDDSGVIALTFAGKIVAVDVSEIYHRVLKMWDRLARQPGRQPGIK